MKILNLLVFLLLLESGPVGAQEWNIDYAHSQITFSVNHFFIPVNGRFEEFEGNLKFDPDNPSESKVNFTVQINSVNTDQEKRDKDLVSKSFFNAKEYPTMSFTSSKIEKKNEGYVLHGELTIKDITKEVEIPFSILGRGEHPMRKGFELMGLKTEFKLDRTDYEVGTGNWAATAVVGNQVTATVTLEVFRKQ